MRRALILMCAATGLLMASCSSTPAGSSTPTTTGGAKSSQSSASADVPSSVPSVTDPIDMSEYKRRPCNALTEAQLRELSIPTEPEPDLDAPEGPVCDWDAFDETGLVLRGGPLTSGSSLAGSYRRNRQGGFENFKPIKVAGYPGILNWHDNRSCTASVGVRNDLLYGLVVTVDEDSSHQGEQCQIARDAVELATITMSGSS